jgi:hypothetical protein
MLWDEFSLINDMLQTLVDLAEREHGLSYDEQTGELIIPPAPTELQPPILSKYHNPYV